MRRPNHASRFEGIAKTNLQASRASDTETLQSQVNKAAKKRLSLSGLEILHGRLMNAVKRRNSKNYNFKFRASSVASPPPMRRPNHASRFEGIAKTNLQASRASDTETLQSQVNKAAKKRLSLSGLEILHGRLMNAVKRRNSKNYNFKFTELNDGWFDVRYAAPHWYDGRDPQLMNAVKRRNSKNYNFKFTELNDGWFDVRYAAPLFAESYSFASPENGKAP